jgi:hypothetical protein
MATKKKAATKKRAVTKKAVVAAAVAAEAAPKKRRKTYTKRQLTLLLDQMLMQFAEQMATKPLTYTAGDGLRLMQMRENAAPERPTEVKVGWVEEPRP